MMENTWNLEMNTTQTKRYFGMTIVQLAILGCLACVACGLMAGSLVFISGSRSGSGFALFPTPVPSSTPQPTFTPYLTETPSLTPTVPPVPYEDLIPSGWNQYTTENIELWVPSQFEPVNIEQEREERNKLYRELGLDDLAGNLEDEPPAYVFWFAHPAPDKVLIAANITIEPRLMTAESLDVYLDQEVADLSQRSILVSRQDFVVGEYEARRLIEEVNLGSNYAGAVHYVIFDGINVWVISGTSHFNEFYAWLPEFDKVARTFRLIGQ